MLLNLGGVNTSENDALIVQDNLINIDTLSTQLLQPWGIGFLDDSRIIITEKNGSILIYQNGKISTVKGVPEVISNGQGGLLDIAVHPDFDKNQLIYFTATVGTASSYSTALFKARLDDSNIDTKLASLEKIFQALPMNSSNGHFGSRIVIDSKGYIFLSLGERFNKSTAQDISNHNGTIIRIKENGDVPNDNPFFSNQRAKPEIWSYGHRNVQGLAKNPLTNQIWSVEHGPKGGDEINLIVKGGNYGWPLATFGLNYDGTVISNDTTIAGGIDPKYYWVPSIAPCGMNFYNSNVIPQWNGDLFIGALKGRHLNKISIKDNKVIKEERLLNDIGRVRQVVQGPDGLIYLVTESPGLLLRIKPVELSIYDPAIPENFILHENYPNPFNPSTQIRFDLPETSNVRLTIYNMIGQKIRAFNIQNAPAGYHALNWNATNDYGQQVSAGVYLYQLQAKGFSRTKKMILLK